MLVATAPTDCSPQGCSPRTGAWQGTPNPPHRVLVPTGAQWSTPRQKRAHDTIRAIKARAMAHETNIVWALVHGMTSLALANRWLFSHRGMLHTLRGGNSVGLGQAFLRRQASTEARSRLVRVCEAPPVCSRTGSAVGPNWNSADDFHR